VQHSLIIEISRIVTFVFLHSLLISALSFFHIYFSLAPFSFHSYFSFPFRSQQSEGNRLGIILGKEGVICVYIYTCVCVCVCVCTCSRAGGTLCNVFGWGTVSTSQKVVGLIPNVVWFFNWPIPFRCTMALESTQRLTEMSTRNLRGVNGGWLAGSWGWQPHRQL
jgi:hypothetical protein